jgi:hypothetical protein
MPIFIPPQIVVTTALSFIAQATPVDNAWESMAYAPALDLFVVVGASGVNNRVMKSSDGVTWATEVSAADNAWLGVTWSPELSLFVAVAADGAQRVMTSPNGINWTIRNAADNGRFWRAVTWSPQLGMFCAVHSDATQSVMTSFNGTAWTTRNTPVVAPENVEIAWSPKLLQFVAVNKAINGQGMVSTDGINWVATNPPAGTPWGSIAWSPELALWVMVSGGAGADVTCHSSDGVNWTVGTAGPAFNSWTSVIWLDTFGIFVATAYTTTDVIWSRDGINWINAGGTSAIGWVASAWAHELGVMAVVAEGGAPANVHVQTSCVQFHLQ